MTKKRFTLAYKKDDWWAVRDDEITLWKEEVVHLLNKLHEEKQYWKQKYDRQVGEDSIISFNQTNELKKENQQLKEFIKYMGFTIEKENGNNIRFVYKDLRR